MAALINFIGIFYILIMLVCITLFFVIKDDWYKMLFFASSCFMFLILLFFTNFQGNIDNDVSLVQRIDTLDDVDITDMNYLGSDVVNKADDIFSFNILTEEFEDGEYYNRYSENLKNAEFCFAYNNTDDSNVIRINSGITPISDYFYLINNSVGEVCIDIEVTAIKHGALLGIRCLDCAIGNTLNFPYVNGSIIDEVYISKANPLTYTIEKTLPHKIWINSYYLPVDQVNGSLYIFNYGLAIFVLLFGSRYVWKLFFEEVMDGF